MLPPRVEEVVENEEQESGLLEVQGSHLIDLQDNIKENIFK